MKRWSSASTASLMRVCLTSVRLTLLWLTLIWLTLAWPAPISAHHPLSNYNLDQTQTLNGILVGLQIANPHSLLYLDVVDQTDKSQRWTIEWAPALLLKKQGVSASTLAEGDHLVVTGFAARDPAEHRLRLRTIRRPSDGWTWTGGFN
jgi:Family of unknown function (DUF6152)